MKKMMQEAMAMAIMGVATMEKIIMEVTTVEVMMEVVEMIEE